MAKIQIKTTVTIVTPVAVTAYFGIDAEQAEAYINGDQDVDAGFMACECTVDRVDVARAEPSKEDVGQEDSLSEQLEEFFASAAGKAQIRKALDHG